MEKIDLIKSIMPCTCDIAYISRNISAPDCAFCNYSERLAELITVPGKEETAKSLDECKDEVAGFYGFAQWSDMPADYFFQINSSKITYEGIIDLANKRYYAQSLSGQTAKDIADFNKLKNCLVEIADGIFTEELNLREVRSKAMEAIKEVFNKS